jgi:hypothetical protein
MCHSEEARTRSVVILDSADDLGLRCAPDVTSAARDNEEGTWGKR